MCLLGCDIGSSSVKASIVDKDTGLTLASDFYPKEEAAIKAVRPGWAEQNPDDWWMYLCLMGIALSSRSAKSNAWHIF